MHDFIENKRLPSSPAQLGLLASSGIHTFDENETGDISSDVSVRGPSGSTTYFIGSIGVARSSTGATIGRRAVRPLSSRQSHAEGTSRFDRIDFEGSVSSREPNTLVGQLHALATSRLANSEPQLVLGAIRIAALLPKGTPVPKIAIGDGEVTIEWHQNQLSLVGSVEADGGFGYAYLEGNEYLPGTTEVLAGARSLPDDLLSYLMRFSAPD